MKSTQMKSSGYSGSLRGQTSLSIIKSTTKGDRRKIKTEDVSDFCHAEVILSAYSIRTTTPSGDESTFCFLSITEMRMERGTVWQYVG